MDVNKARPGTFSKPRSSLQEDKNFGGNVGRLQPGITISSSDVTTTTQRANTKESSSTSLTSKRNSKLNIPAAFLADKQGPAMNRPPVVPKKFVTTPMEENKPGVIPRPALKPKVLPMDKESSVATILRSINTAQSNQSHENGDVSNTESETVKKTINPFLALDREKKIESSTNKPATPVKPLSRSDSDKPVPPWKMPKSAESDKPTPPWKVPKPDTDSEKPVPPWKVRASQEQDSENKSENVPPWKAKKIPVDTNNVSEEKPVLLWKQKNLQNKPETLNKPETTNKSESPPTPSWKANTEPMAKDGNKQPPSKLKSPFLANQSELNAVIGKLNRTSSVSSDEPPPVHRNLRLKKSIKRKSLTRTFDQKKFFAVDIQTIEAVGNPPPKPAKMLGAVNIDIIVERYKARLAPSSGGKTEPSPEAEVEEELEVDELYEELPEEPVAVRRRSEGQDNSRASKAVSLIPDMASDEEEEEYDDTANVVGTPQASLPPPPPKDLPPPPGIPSRARPPPPQIPSTSDPSNDLDQEEYADAEAGELEEEALEQDDVYEPLDEIQEEMDKKEEEERKRQQDEKKAEKERKEREEREKKEEQKRLKAEKKRQEEEKKRQEKEMKALKKKFNIQPSDLDSPQGEGDIKEDDKGGKNNLEVKKGMRVQLIRLTDNPKGKWLVRLAPNGLVGYVESSNVEVDNNLIKSVMAGDYMNSLPPPPPEFLMDDGEEYADADIGAEEQDGELYEDV